MGTLTGLKILDFSSLMPGPMATMFLADLGADVISVAAPGKPDLMNVFPPMIDEVGLSASAAWLGRNKRSISLNLKKPQAVEAVKRMVRTYDIVVEQFRPGVMEKMGLGYEALKAENPGVIYCSITGYGQSGPLAQRPGHDINYMALSGNLLLMGEGCAPEPVMPNFQLADLAGGSYLSAVGILAAVYRREKTGLGQHIDISMLDGVLPFGCVETSGALASEQYPAGWEERTMSGLCQGPSYGFFETADGKYMSVGALEPKFFAQLCQGLGIPEWADGRILHTDPDEAERRLREIFRTKTRDAWTAHFKDLDACVEPVLTIPEMCGHEQVRARGMTPEVPVPLTEGKCVRQLGTPIKLSETPAEYRHAAYPKGYHTGEVLKDLGYTDREIQELSQ